MSELPGGRMAYRPVHFFWLLDCSTSMSINGKIGALNFAVHEAIPEMRQAAGENASAQLLVRVITFSTGAQWHVRIPTPIEQFEWSDVTANGVTDLGAALRMVARELQTPPMPERAMQPVLALVSDGLPTDDWRDGLHAVDNTPWGPKTIRVAVSIGQDADAAMLKEFLANPEMEPLQADNPTQLARAIRWTSTVAVRAASTPAAGGVSGRPAAPPPAGDDDNSVIW
jgi:uncharacterized protein YegL